MTQFCFQVNVDSPGKRLYLGILPEVPENVSFENLEMSSVITALALW